MRQLQWQLASTVIWQGAKSHLIAEHLLLILTTNWTSSNQWSWAVALLVTLNLAWQQGMRFLHRQVHTSACSSLKIAIWSSRLSADKSVLRTEWPRYGEVWKERSPWSCFACRWSHSYYWSTSMLLPPIETICSVVASTVYVVLRYFRILYDHRILCLLTWAVETVLTATERASISDTVTLDFTTAIK